MKRIIYVLTFLSFLLFLNVKADGQDLINMDPNYFYITSGTDSLPEFIALRGMGHLSTDSEDTILVKWKVTGWENCPSEWSYTLADTQYSFPFGTISNIDSSNAIYAPMPLWGSLSFNQFYFEVYPGQTSGCCRIQVHFSLLEEPDSILETATFDYSVLDSACFVSPSHEIIEQAQAQVYPNPANDVFEIQSNIAFSSAVLYDLTGNFLFKDVQVSPSKIETSLIPNGLYLLKLELVNGQSLWRKIVVQH